MYILSFIIDFEHYFLVKPSLILSQFWRPFTSTLCTNGLFGELLIVGFYFGWVGVQRERFLGTIAKSIVFLTACKSAAYFHSSFRLFNCTEFVSFTFNLQSWSNTIDIYQYTLSHDEPRNICRVSSLQNRRTNGRLDIFLSKKSSYRTCLSSFLLVFYRWTWGIGHGLLSQHTLDWMALEILFTSIKRFTSKSSICLW